jgi:hypothetical protein
MGATLFWRYPSDSAAFTATSEKGQGYEVTNLVLKQLGRGWESDTTLTQEIVTLTFPVLSTVNMIGIIGHNFTDTYTVDLQGADDLAFTTPTTIQINYRADRIIQSFAASDFLYWRLRITKDAASDGVIIGRLVIGQAFELSTALGATGALYGPGSALDDTQVVRAGLRYADSGEVLDELGGQLVGLTEAEVEEWSQLVRFNGTGVPFIIVAAPHRTRIMDIYGTLTQVRAPTSPGPDLYNVTLAMIESK